MIAFDAFDSDTALPGDTATFSHTCTGSNRVLWMFIAVNGAGGADPVTSVTYNGVSLTEVTSASFASGNITYAYVYVNPPSGSHTAEVITNDAGSFLRVISASYTGVGTITQPDAFGSGTVNPGTSVTATVNVGRGGCWMVSAVGDDGALTCTPSGVLTTSRATISDVLTVGDSNGVIGTGNQNATWTFGSQSANCVGVSMIPAPSGGGFFLI